MIYCYPKLSERDFLFFRIIGPGLGNLLFPWARAVVAAQKPGYQLIAPTWPQLKLGTLIRREADTRMYTDLFKQPPEYLQGIKRLNRLLTATHVSEANQTSARPGQIIEFIGMDHMFSPIANDFGVVRAALIAMTRQKHLEGLSTTNKSPISVHVRLGDFAVASPESKATSANNTRTPISWYCRAVKAIRTVRGTELPVQVFSDGTDLELSELLALPNCTRVSFGSAIADILALSNADTLVASGSTFSMWASYLGRMPVIWPPGQEFRSLYETDPAFSTAVAKNLAQ